MKLWDKGVELDRLIERFTVGDDPVIDMRLVPHDCRASLAHATGLRAAGLLSDEEFAALSDGLQEILDLHRKGEFQIRPGDEDVHTAIENHLVARHAGSGLKIHTGRSRNDQVLAALRLYEKEALANLDEGCRAFESSLAEVIQASGDVPMPGYTHLRPAMPTTAGMWLGAFQESSRGNREFIAACRALVDRSPLGTAAGFGVPLLPLDRELVAREAGFSGLIENPFCAQHGRGKLEADVVHAAVRVLFDLNKLATDLILFSTREFGFVVLPEEFCTGSSIMPQKKNPDVLELLRARYHQVLGCQGQIQSTIGNLPSGYNRDLQLTKAPLFQALDSALDCVAVATHVLRGIRLDRERSATALSRDLYATEEAYRLVAEGVPFREAYRRVSRDQRGE